MVAEAAKRRYKQNPEKFRAYQRSWKRKWLLGNRKESSDYWKDYNKKRSAYLISYRRRYRTANRERLLAQNKTYRSDPVNRQKSIENAKRWRLENPERNKQSNRNYITKNRAVVSSRKIDYVLRRRKTDLQFRLLMVLRTRINCAIRGVEGADKSARTVALLGCSVEFFKSFLESQFKPGMSWDNHGTVWQIDHVIPIAKFDITTPDGQRQAFNYSNCQPLLCELNAAKKDQLPGPHQPLLI